MNESLLDHGAELHACLIRVVRVDDALQVSYQDLGVPNV